MGKIRVLIVDDSKLIQQLITELISADENIEVVGVASDANQARDLIKQLDPDVLTLDIMMPGMDGLTFLKNIMRLRPMPVIMLSALTKVGSEIGLEALANGAIDFVEKPSARDLQSPEKYAKKLVESIKTAAQSNLKLHQIKKTEASQDNSMPILLSSDLLNQIIVGIGASTGGVEALEMILSQLPQIFPPVLITLHIRREFNPIFLRRLSSKSRLIIQEAKDMERIQPGHVYLAVPDHHLTVGKIDSAFYTQLIQAPPVNSHIPSVDMLFSSIAKNVANNSIGVLLTGMGVDGAVGLKLIKEAGGATIAEDEETSVVWGMPGAAVKLQVVEHIVPLYDITKKILNVIDEKGQR